jgi:integrase
MVGAAERYLAERQVSSVYAKRVRFIARGCGEFEVGACNRYLKKRLGEVSSVTVAPERVTIVSLWRHAFELGLVDNLPRGLLRVRVARPPVRAWTIGQCCTAVKHTFLLDGKILRCGAPLGVFLRCWMLLGYEVGARQADLWGLRGDDICDGTVAWTQRKTGAPHFRKLSGPCWLACQEMLKLSPDGRILGWVMTMGAGRKRMKALLRGLGMAGSGKWLRRSGATHIEMREPGKARVHLGHKTDGMAERFYIDWAQVSRDVPVTPALIE